MVSVSWVAALAMVGESVSRKWGGVDCAVDSDAEGRLGLESTVGSAVVSGEVVREMMSSSRTEIYEG